MSQELLLLAHLLAKDYCVSAWRSILSAILLSSNHHSLAERLRIETAGEGERLELLGVRAHSAARQPAC